VSKSIPKPSCNASTPQAAAADPAHPGPPWTADGFYNPPHGEITATGPDDGSAPGPPPADEFSPYTMQRAVQGLFPGHRVSYCLKQPRYDRVDIASIKTNDGDCRCHYRGLARCADVWVCPVCAVRIAQRRQAEVEAACAEWIRRGGAIAMLTLTMPHSRDDDLSTLLDQLGDALQRTRRGAPWQRIAQRFGLFTGGITAKESTWGEAAGWHPHFHVILFVAGDTLAEDLEAAIAPRWHKMVQKASGRSTNEHGCRVTMSHDVSDAAALAGGYLCKGGLGWGAAGEVTGEHSKEARGGRYTPRQILAAYTADCEMGRHRESRWGALFREYASAYKGRQLLNWAPHLKNELGVNVVDDEEAAEEEPPETEVIATMGPRAWEQVRYEGAQGRLLEIARVYGFEGVRAWLAVRGLDCGVTDPPWLEALSPAMVAERLGASPPS